MELERYPRINRGILWFASIPLLVILVLSCNWTASQPDYLPLERDVCVLNISGSHHLVLELETPEHEAVLLPMIPPGGRFRKSFSDEEILGTPCPEVLTLRAFLYKQNDTTNANRSRGDILSKDGTEFTLTASAEETIYTVCRSCYKDVLLFTLRRTPEGQGALLFSASDRQWLFFGKSIPAPPTIPDQIPDQPIQGRMLTIDGDPVPDVELRIYAKVRDVGDPCDGSNLEVSRLLACTSGLPTPEPDARELEHISPSYTDATGGFRFDLPPGVYVIEALSEDYLFRPAFTEFVAPRTNLVFIAEPKASPQNGC